MSGNDVLRNVMVAINMDIFQYDVQWTHNRIAIGRHVKITELAGGYVAIEGYDYSFLVKAEEIVSMGYVRGILTFGLNEGTIQIVIG